MDVEDEQQHQNRRVSKARRSPTQDGNFTLKARISVLSGFSHLLDGLNSHSSLQSWIKNNERSFSVQPIRRKSDAVSKSDSRRKPCCFLTSNNEYSASSRVENHKSTQLRLFKFHFEQGDNQQQQRSRLQYATNVTPMCSSHAVFCVVIERDKVIGRYVLDIHRTSSRRNFIPQNE